MARGEGGRSRIPDTKTVRFGISQNLWYACAYGANRLTLSSVFHKCRARPSPFPIALSRLNALCDSQSAAAPTVYRDGSLFLSQLGLFICNRGILPSNYAAVNC